jgi:hypothetical protein
MKKLYFAIFALISGNTFCQTNIDFEDFTLSGSETYFDGSDFSGTSNGNGQLETIYNSGTLTFNSVYDTTWGASSGYWSTGWAFSNVTTDTLQGFAGLFSSYAGGGDVSTNYAIGQNNSIITNSSIFSSFESIRVTNNNYAASSMLNGDSFAKKFGGASGDDQDWFLMEIIGFDELDAVIDTVKFYLADYRFADNSQDYIIKGWKTVDLSAVSNASHLKIELTSSDNSNGYMNTPAFYAVDNVKHSSAVGVFENELNDIVLFPNPSTNVINISNTSSDQELMITNIQGQVISSQRLSEGTTTISVIDLPKGLYQVTILTKEGNVTKKFQKI